MGIKMEFFKSCEGVELLKSRHDLAMSKRDELIKFRKAKVKLIEGDLLEYPVGHGDLIYISSLCFEKELLEKIAEKLVKECKYGVHVHSNRALKHPQLRELNILTVEQTWKSLELLYTYIQKYLKTSNTKTIKL